jgi:hypothetical protein
VILIIVTIANACLHVSKPFVPGANSVNSLHRGKTASNILFDSCREDAELKNLVGTIPVIFFFRTSIFRPTQ